MSNTAKAGKQPTLRLSTPKEMLAAVPYLLGFHPADSLVAVALQGSAKRGHVHCTMRMDLPRSEEERTDSGGRVVDRFRRESITQVILIGYGEPDQVTHAVERVTADLGDVGITVPEALRVRDGRYWSYTCTNPSCCPPEGVPYDGSSSAVAAQATAAGISVLPDRAALERSIDSLGGVTRASMRQATQRAQAWADGPVSGSDMDSARRRLRDAGLGLLHSAVERYSTAGERLPDDDIARLGVTLTLIRVRDEAWTLIDEDRRKAHRALWTDVVRRVEPPYLPAPACLLALAAWQDGNAALAGMAVERALAADSAYSLARLLDHGLAGGLPPSAAAAPMTTEELSTSYGCAA